MRTFVAVILSLLVLSAVCLPKSVKHSSKQASKQSNKLVAHAIQDLDEAQEDDVLAEGNFEDDAENDQPALEEDEDKENVDVDAEEDAPELEEDAEDDAEPSLEEEEEEEEDNEDNDEVEEPALEEDEDDEGDVDAEDDAPELEEDEDDADEDENEKVAEKPAPVAKTASKISARKVVAKKSEFEEEEEDFNRVNNDVRQLEEIVASSHISASAKKSANENLKAISHDASEYHATENQEVRDLLRSAINKRIEALHLTLEEAGNDMKVDAEAKKETEAKKEKTIQASAVLKDVRQLEESLDDSHLSAHAKKAVRENLKAMKKDAQELSSASSAKRAKLSEALKLRAQALKTQLHE